jgi:hypothetical protein
MLLRRQIMTISAMYICPVNGVIDFKPPDPGRLNSAAGTARDLGLEKLWLPVVEESLMLPSRDMTRYLDGIIQDLDIIADIGLSAGVIAPARNILGLDFIPPHLAKSFPDPNATPVFTAGKLRNLRPFPWWKDLHIVHKRLALFRELVGALHGHPALNDWALLDGMLDWQRPDSDALDVILKSYLAEIRERDNPGQTLLAVHWNELLHPDMALAFSPQVDGIIIRGLDRAPDDLGDIIGAAGEIRLGAYIGSLTQWLFERPVHVESGWRIFTGMEDPEPAIESAGLWMRQGIHGLIWPSLIDPEPGKAGLPPWMPQKGLEKTGLLDPGGEPKAGVEEFFAQSTSGSHKPDALDFIDISRDNYQGDPEMHFKRLWDHFRDYL